MTFLVVLTQNVMCTTHAHFILCAANDEISETGSFSYSLSVTWFQITMVDSLPDTGIT